VSLGNEADVTETDVIDFLADDPNTRVIALYVEQIRDGQRFMAVARRVTPHKPIVMLRAGRTRAGIAAVSSHTGALAGANQAYDAAFKQCGVIETRSIRELFDISLGLAFQPIPRGGRVFVLSNSGGPAALAADDLSELDVCLPPLSPGTESRLLAGLDPAVLPGNPIDMLGSAGPAEFEFALPIVLSDPGIDAVLVVVVPHMLLNATDTARRICAVAAHAEKPIVTCFVGGPGVSEARRILHQHRIPMYTCPRTASRVIDALTNVAAWRSHQPGPQAGVIPKIDALAVARLLAAANSHRKLGEAATRPIFSACNIPIIAGGLARNAAQAVDLADRLNYPVVLKIVSPDILHKSEAGGVRLNLHNAVAVGKAYRQLLTDADALKPGLNIEGVLVEKMAPRGHEVIVGMRRDPQFGPLLMFGLGGIYVELLTDVSFRIAPIDRDEALAMIYETRAGRLLAGLRGQPPAHIEAVADCILQLSQLALAFPQIEEVEVNPLLVLPHGQGAVALDGRIVLAANRQPHGERLAV
jgi:acetyltransferase